MHHQRLKSNIKSEKFEALLKLVHLIVTFFFVVHRGQGNFAVECLFQLC